MNGEPEVRRQLGRLGSTDHARVWIELALAEDEPALTAAVVRRLLAEIQADRSHSTDGGSEPLRCRRPPRG